MKIAYLVLAHFNPKLVERTIRTLDSEDCAFFLHIDQKSDISMFSGIKGENVFFTDQRVAVYRGEFSQVEAILVMMQKAMLGPDRYDYFVLISGSDYPLRSSQYIQSYLQEHAGSEFLSMVKMPNEALGKPLARINTLVLPSSQPVRRFVARALAKFGFAKRDYRKYLGSLEPYSGSGEWALSRDACQYIFDFMEENPGVTAYFKNTFAADEGFFHTILGNSRFKSKIRRNLLYDDWSASRGSPEIIGDRHVDWFESLPKVLLNDHYGSGEALFTRKVAPDRMDLLQRIDEMIVRKGG
jgi:Core-2/I-Branching enzyme